MQNYKARFQFSGGFRGLDYLEDKNDIVFKRASPRKDLALGLAQDESAFWMLAGAKGLGYLEAIRPEG